MAVNASPDAYTLSTYEDEVQVSGGGNEIREGCNGLAQKPFTPC